MAQTKTNDAAKINVVRFNASGAVYFKGFAEGTDYDTLATSYGLSLRFVDTTNENTAYTQSISFAVSQIPNGGEGTVYVIANAVSGDTATSYTWGFYCGPFCKTVRFSLLVITAAIQKERKDRGSVLSWFGFITSCRVGSSNGRALPQDADRVHTV
jgi:hypothetical protein